MFSEDLYDEMLIELTELLYVQQYLKKQTLYSKGFGLIKKTYNLAIEAEHAEELYKLHQQFIKEMKKELNMQQGHVHHKCIIIFNTSKSAYKKVFKETANMQYNKEISFTASDKSTDIDNANGQKTVMLNNDSTKSHDVILQNQKQDQESEVVINNKNTLQLTSQDIVFLLFNTFSMHFLICCIIILEKTKHAYICENCGKDSHHKS
ncbi:12052_t:CDS:2 [Cetraspora pellucida]|uniref:12052_t:CDS:1 n=1 Tax=Cetraspora pellucida TaxID=1433469 RepID=A0ACA9K3W9_9GLOM|nr:12052_t:CDS:2 [Cetraspora pellucida]